MPTSKDQVHEKEFGKLKLIEEYLLKADALMSPKMKGGRGSQFSRQRFDESCRNPIRLANATTNKGCSPASPLQAPEGLEFDGESYRTATTCLAFSYLHGISKVGSNLASRTGVEPVSPP